jgi:uncharacterized glyoxalase superfamily protein PhnB
MTTPDLRIRTTFLPHDDAEAALGFYRDLLGWELRLDVGWEQMRWLTVGPVGQPDVSVVLHPPAADPATTEEERRVVTEMMAKGTFSSLVLATPDVDATFETLRAGGADVVQEPMDQDWGERDCALRDPAGNLLRIQQVA